MENLFTVKVRYEKVSEDGKEKKVTENYLLDAVSFSEAEQRIYKEMEQMISGEFNVVSIARVNFSEIFTNTDGDIFWKAKLKFVTLDEASGREKMVSSYVLILANNVDHAYKNITEAMKDMTVDFTIEGITDSKIMDFFEYAGQ